MRYGVESGCDYKGSIKIFFLWINISVDLMEKIRFVIYCVVIKFMKKNERMFLCLI